MIDDNKAKTLRLKINGEEYTGLSVNETFALAVQLMFPHIKYMSRENIVFYINDIMGMVESDLDMRVSPMIKNFLIYSKKESTKEADIVLSVYDLMLKLEGLSMGKR